jgi:hypothetical protein
LSTETSVWSRVAEGCKVRWQAERLSASAKPDRYLKNEDCMWYGYNYPQSYQHYGLEPRALAAIIFWEQHQCNIFKIFFVLSK